MPDPEPLVTVPISHAVDPERVKSLEIIQQVHTQQLLDHDGVLKDIRKHLGELVLRYDKFQNRLLLIAVCIFGGTTNGSKVAEFVGQLFT